MTVPYVSIENLHVTFTGGARPVKAVNGVDLRVNRAEVVALIGESGSGKSVTLRSVLRLHNERHTTVSGRIQVGEHDVLALTPNKLTDFRGKTAAMIFQEPLLALDPVYSLGAQITESIRRHDNVTQAQALARALELFERVRIPSPARRLDAYPHEMSGGMRQRAMIALALACKPQLVLADEPTTALDATVQIQVLLLLRELQREFGLSVIFVTHDIGAAVEVADRIAVMYAGRIVEEGPVATLLRAPRHPYTMALLRSRAHGAMDKVNGKRPRLVTIAGAPPDLSLPQVGCSFAPRCTLANDTCKQTQPDATTIGPGHSARCFRLNETQ